MIFSKPLVGKKCVISFIHFNCNKLIELNDLLNGSFNIKRFDVIYTLKRLGFHGTYPNSYQMVCPVLFFAVTVLQEWVVHGCTILANISLSASKTSALFYFNSVNLQVMELDICTLWLPVITYCVHNHLSQNGKRNDILCEIVLYLHGP